MGLLWSGLSGVHQERRILSDGLGRGGQALQAGSFEVIQCCVVLGSRHPHCGLTWFYFWSRRVGQCAGCGGT